MKVSLNYNSILNVKKYFKSNSDNQEMIQINKNKNDFLAAISHEIRSPLNVIYSCAELLKMEAGHRLNKECHEYVENIQSYAEDALNITSDLLDTMRACSGKFSVDLSNKIDLKITIEKVVKMMRYMAMGRKIIINSEIADDLPLVNLDQKRIRQVLINLISNAIKYSPSDTKIEVVSKLSADNKFLEIIIADQGFGMTQEEINKALQKYQTINNPNSGKVDAFGLGLPLVKDLVEMQNGQMNIESEKDRGTRISLRFAL